MTVDHRTQTVLITGASSGIGSAFARELARRGSDLVLVARRADRLDALAAALRREHGVAVLVLPADLAEPTAVAELLAATDDAGVEVTALINNAGFGTWGPFVEEAPARLEQELALDVAAPVRMAAAFLPRLVAAQRGYLINVASMAAYTPAPRMAVYAASKAFVLSFTEALWAETRRTGPAVFALSPGATATEFDAVVGTENATAGARPRRPEDVVATALAHLARRHPGPSVIDGAGNRLAAAFSGLVPRRTAVLLMDRLTDPARRGGDRGTVRPAVAGPAR